MICKKFGTDFNSSGGALTLSTSEVTEGNESQGVHIRKHDDGWIIMGEIHEDYYAWVNKFVALHEYHGIVCGDFESEIYASSEEGFKDFYDKHTPNAWDYGDI